MWLPSALKAASDLGTVLEKIWPVIKAHFRRAVHHHSVVNADGPENLVFQQSGADRFSIDG